MDMGRRLISSSRSAFRSPRSPGVWMASVFLLVLLILSLSISATALENIVVEPRGANPTWVSLSGWTNTSATACSSVLGQFANNTSSSMTFTPHLAGGVYDVYARHNGKDSGNDSANVDAYCAVTTGTVISTSGDLFQGWTHIFNESTADCTYYLLGRIRTSGSSYPSVKLTYKAGTLDIGANRWNVLGMEFTQIYDLTYFHLTVAKGAGGSSVTGDGYYQSGAVVPITATASTDYHFVNWTGGTVANANSASTTCTTGASDQTVTANFAVTDYNLTVDVLPDAGDGAVTVSGSNPRHYNDSITVTAARNPGYAFVNWTDGLGATKSTSTSYTFTMPTSDLTLHANFVPGYVISGTPNPAGAGTCTGPTAYTPGSGNISWSASPAIGRSLTAWTLDLAGANVLSTTNPYVFTPAADTTLFAQFGWTNYTLTAAAGSSGHGSVGGDSGTKTYGQSCTVTAAADPGYQFLTGLPGLTGPVGCLRLPVTRSICLPATTASMRSSPSRCGSRGLNPTPLAQATALTRMMQPARTRRPMAPATPGGGQGPPNGRVGTSGTTSATVWAGAKTSSALPGNCKDRRQPRLQVRSPNPARGQFRDGMVVLRLQGRWRHDHRFLQRFRSARVLTRLFPIPPTTRQAPARVPQLSS